MRSIIRRFVAVAALAFAAACGSENPIASSAPTSPRRDGGVTFGSGARASEPQNTTAAADSGSTAATSQGGLTFGSGA